MLSDHDHIEAIFLVARHGREALDIVNGHRHDATGRGDAEAAKRWRSIQRFIRRNIAAPQMVAPVR